MLNTFGKFHQNPLRDVGGGELGRCICAKSSKGHNSVKSDRITNCRQYAPGHLMLNTFGKFHQNPLRDVRGVELGRNCSQRPPACRTTRPPACRPTRPPTFANLITRISPSENLVNNLIPIQQEHLHECHHKNSD